MGDVLRVRAFVRETHEQERESEASAGFGRGKGIGPGHCPFARKKGLPSRGRIQEGEPKIPYLDGDNNSRYLHLHNYDHEWNTRWRFLAVPL